MQRHPISKLGYQRLLEELRRLKTEERPVILERIDASRSLGDPAENCDYQAALESLQFLENRIVTLETRISNLEIIHFEDFPADKVVFGLVVTLLDVDTDETLRYQLLGPEEAQVRNGSISVLSPIGQALLGKSVGDEVIAHAPKGSREFEILSIENPTQVLVPA